MFPTITKMTTFNIEDVSPLITYDEKWTAGDKVNDPLASKLASSRVLLSLILIQAQIFWQCNLHGH